MIAQADLYIDTFQELINLPQIPHFLGNRFSINKHLSVGVQTIFCMDKFPIPTDLL